MVSVPNKDANEYLSLSFAISNIADMMFFITEALTLFSLQEVWEYLKTLSNKADRILKEARDDGESAYLNWVSMPPPAKMVYLHFIFACVKVSQDRGLDEEGGALMIEDLIVNSYNHCENLLDAKTMKTFPYVYLFHQGFFQGCVPRNEYDLGEDDG